MCNQGEVCQTFTKTITSKKRCFYGSSTLPGCRLLLRKALLRKDQHVMCCEGTISAFPLGANIPLESCCQVRAFCLLPWPDRQPVGLTLACTIHPFTQGGGMLTDEGQEQNVIYLAQSKEFDSSLGVGWDVHTNCLI